MNKYILVCKKCDNEFPSPSPYIKRCRKCINKSKTKKYPVLFQNRRRFVFLRDNFCCQDCGENLKNDDLRRHCHHIDKNTRNNKYSNLITLCPSCHSKADSNNKKFITKPYSPKIINVPKFKRKKKLMFKNI